MSNSVRNDSTSSPAARSATARSRSTARRRDCTTSRTNPATSSMTVTDGGRYEAADSGAAPPTGCDVPRFRGGRPPPRHAAIDGHHRRAGWPWRSELPASTASALRMTASRSPTHGASQVRIGDHRTGYCRVAGWPAVAEHLEQQRAECVDIGGGRDRAARALLGRGV